MVSGLKSKDPEAMMVHNQFEHKSADINECRPPGKPEGILAKII